MKTIHKGATALFAILSFTLISLTSLAQTGEIRGRLFDGITKESLPGATVTYKVAGTTRGVVTDIDGYFKIKPLNPGYYDIELSFVGYQQLSIEGIHVSSNKITDLHDRYISIDELQPHIVYGWIDDIINFEDPSAIPLGIEDIQGSVAKHDPIALIATMGSGIKASPDGKQLYFRGERAEAVLYIVDGVKTRGGLGIPGQAIGHITVYTGGVPAKYGDFTGGVVVIETRSYQDVVAERRRAMQR